MAANPTDPPRKDTRGLPEGYDPHQFYEYRRDTLIKTATGIESFVYKYIPWSISRSFAFAIDPTAPFKVSTHAITPYNRHRTRSTASVLQIRKKRTTNINISHSQTPNFGGIAVCWSPGLNETITYNFDQTTDLATQPALVDEIDDATSRTRLMDSKQSTMRYFKSYINCPPRFAAQKDRYEYIYHPAPGIPSPECSERGGAGNTRSNSQDTKRADFMPTAAVLYPNSLSSLRDAEYAYLESLISANALGLFKEWSPNKRSSTLFRNIVELRDVSRSIVSLQKTLLDLGLLYRSLAKSPHIQRIVFDLKNVARDIPSEYLSYHFGWKQTYKDVMDLLKLPETMSKKYSFLIKRAGKPTTFRVKKDFESSRSDSLPAFDYDSAPWEYGVSTETRLERKTQLRLVVNATFDFPPVNGVSFQSGSMLDRMGLVPRPTDLYNLTPWTWLVDWFTGLGNYVEVIDNMARDNSLINWGMITGHTTGRLITRYKSKVDNRLTVTEDFVGATTSTSTEELYHESVLEYECQIRKDAAAAFTVNTISGPNLSGYQKSILGALLAQRKGGFTPRS